jgi:putative SOS response-associated peptidase YedK
MEAYFNVRPHQFKLSDRYNVAPSTDIPVIRLIDGERTLSLVRWSLIPSWAQAIKIGYKMINARA